MDQIKVVGLNLDISWKNKEANFSKIEQELSDISADLFVLPEMFSTGFVMDPETIADRNEESLQWMMTFAAKKNAAITGSASVCENEKFFNRMYFVKPDQTYEYYDKRHLFSFSGEDKSYSRGERKVVVEHAGFRFLLQICYDLRFPVFSRNTSDYDVALYVANWPVKRVEAWNHLLKARAIENQVYVLGVNRIGEDGNALFYTESSTVFFADGSIVSEKRDNLVQADLNLQKLREFQNHFQFLNDRDDFQVNI